MDVLLKLHRERTVSSADVRAFVRALYVPEAQIEPVPPDDVPLDTLLAARVEYTRADVEMLMDALGLPRTLAVSRVAFVRALTAFTRAAPCVHVLFGEARALPRAELATRLLALLRSQ
ncbi:MC139R [Molluscum contagiosum virus subtype 1]|uniref:MC139R n=4 Tax=Molluscum contagiosum virus TaxID=10279 RepID=A0A7G5AXE0_MCV1|nr:MC139R [Molluscum contagiosum virus subtype 1]AZT86324.1 MC139R [Molluscum contagiosum virus]AAC55267.1 MC139R [Molluscum contagiosum virus subtype 1]AQY16888.1 MC139 [Molluscum contagiosum virus subtype 1]AQY17067.1 MC139 [Molluscum contagiosum virus subtype 1]AQY17246.1 MC139 [Molluscum contagiosum virus subtype 1]